MHMIVPLPGNEGFARDLPTAGGWQLRGIETRRFPDGKTFVRLLDGVTDIGVDFVCTRAHPDAGCPRLILAADADFCSPAFSSLQPVAKMRGLPEIATDIGYPLTTDEEPFA